MACILTAGYPIGCRDNTGGVKAVYIAKYDPTAAFTLGTNGEISTITSAEDFYTFAHDVEVATFNQAGNYSTENGTSFYEQTVEMTMIKLTAESRNQLAILGQGAWRVMILDNNGTYFMIGKVNPVRVTAATAGAGKAFGDLNGVMITLTGKEPLPANTVLAATAIGAIA